jgi:hypothetical protein
VPELISRERGDTHLIGVVKYVVKDQESDRSLEILKVIDLST